MTREALIRLRFIARRASAKHHFILRNFFDRPTFARFDVHCPARVESSTVWKSAVEGTLSSRTAAVSSPRAASKACRCREVLQCCSNFAYPEMALTGTATLPNFESTPEALHKLQPITRAPVSSFDCSTQSSPWVLQRRLRHAALFTAHEHWPHSVREYWHAMKC